jgi:hypothetical protein
LICIHSTQSLCLLGVTPFLTSRLEFCAAPAYEFCARSHQFTPRMDRLAGPVLLVPAAASPGPRALPNRLGGILPVSPLPRPLSLTPRFSEVPRPPRTAPSPRLARRGAPSSNSPRGTRRSVPSVYALRPFQTQICKANPLLPACRETQQHKASMFPQGDPVRLKLPCRLMNTAMHGAFPQMSDHEIIFTLQAVKSGGRRPVYLQQAHAANQNTGSYFNCAICAPGAHYLYGTI